MDERLEKIRISSKVGSSIWETIDDGWYLCKASYIDRLINNGTIEINNTDESDQYKAKIEELQNRVSELEQMLSGVDTYEYALEKFGEQIVENYSEHKRLEAYKNNLSKAHQVRLENRRVTQANIIRLVLFGKSNKTIAEKLCIDAKTVYNNLKVINVDKYRDLCNCFSETIFSDVPEKFIKGFMTCNCDSKRYRAKFKSVSGVVIPQPTKIEPPQEIEKLDNQPVIEEPAEKIEPLKQDTEGVSIEDILRMNEDFQEELALEERQRSRLERQKKEEQATQGKYLDYYNDRMAYLKEHKLLPYDDNFNFPKQEPIYEEIEF